MSETDLKAPNGQPNATLADQVTLAVVNYRLNSLENRVEKSFNEIATKLDNLGNNFVTVSKYEALEARVKKQEAIWDWLWKGIGLILLGAVMGLIITGGKIPGR